MEKADLSHKRIQYGHSLRCRTVAWRMVSPLQWKSFPLFHVRNKWSLPHTGSILRDKLHLFPKRYSLSVQSRGHLLQLITKPDPLFMCSRFSLPPHPSPYWPVGLFIEKFMSGKMQLCEETMRMIKRRWWSVKLLMRLVRRAQTSGWKRNDLVVFKETP